MVAWKTGLSGILDVVAAAKKKSGGAAPAPAPAAAATTNGVEGATQAQEAAA